MKSVVLAHQADWAGWRAAARGLALAEVAPEQVVWSVGAPDDLFAEPEPYLVDDMPAAGGFSLPRALVDLAETVVMARDPARFALLYRLVWRVLHGQRQLMQDAADPEVHRAQGLAQSVRRDVHKMRAFVRFAEVTTDAGTRHVAWFEPEHHILEANAPFFARRFATMAWSILTPERSAHWDGATLLLGPGADPADVPDDDALEAYWRAYYGAIFNPARLKVSAMLSEMPQKYWRNLPEARAIPELIRSAGQRTEDMIARSPAVPKPATPPAAVPLPPPGGEWESMARDAKSCRACPLWQPATQTVFGEGPVTARLVLVGEQPGDQEDLAGRPFVGPAGQLLDHALVKAGLDRTQIYITNAVKHFKFTARGKRRIHEKPSGGEIEACRFWLTRELDLVKPQLVVALGGSAAQALLGRPVTISRTRGAPIPLADGRTGFVTVHPSYLLRLPDEDSKRREYHAFVQDLRRAAELAQ